MLFKQAADLDIVWGSLGVGEAFVEAAVDTDVPEFAALEACLIVLRMIIGKGCVMVVSGPPDFCVVDGNLLFVGQ